jgi:predicted AlkP superfamily phosphohydrolase/phosphomutase
MLLDEVSAYLKADIDPLYDLPIISETYRGADVYHGPHSHRGPDLIIEYNNFFNLEGSTKSFNPFVEGGHTQRGIFLASGSEIAAGKLDGISLMDLAPTILYLFDQPIPPDMDGRVLSEIFTQDRLIKHPIVRGERPACYHPDEIIEVIDGTLSAEEETDLEEQLRQLGYI